MSKNKHKNLESAVEQSTELRLVNIHLQDGIVNPTDCVTMARKMAKAGFVGAVLAPWVHQIYPQVNRQSIEELVESSRTLLKGDAEDFRLVGTGVLVISDSGLIPWAEETGFIADNQKGSVLFVRFFNNAYRPEYAQAIRTLVGWGYRPVLIHPELSRFPAGMMLREVAALAEIGVEFLGDLRSFNSPDPDIFSRSRELLAEGHYTWIGTSAQLSDDVTDAIEGLNYLRHEQADAWVTAAMGIDSVFGRLGVVEIVTETAGG